MSFTSAMKLTQHSGKKIIQTAKHNNATIKLAGFFTAAKAGQINITDGTINTGLYLKKI